MLKLNGHIEAIQQPKDVRSRLFKITTDSSLPPPIRDRFALLTNAPANNPGYGVQLMTSEAGNGVPLPSGAIYRLPPVFSYLQDGDIIWIDDTRKFLETLYRNNTFHNAVLLTEQCNHYCLMCSQPPKKIDDSYLLKRAFDLVNLIPQTAQRIGFTGGEPTLYGSALIDLIRHTKIQLPNTSIDVLSNGRRFKEKEYAKQFASAGRPNCTVAIPIYSDDPVRHDYVVQAEGAFDETVQGILNLKRFGQRVEIRIVLHQQTIERLVSTCEFICRNLLFVDHVALMGLEITGFTRANLASLWIDPYDYKDTLSDAVHVLNSYGMNASVYNHQLCVVNKDVKDNYRKSISDWKNEYLDVCDPCARKSDCGGFFSSSKLYKHSIHIEPFA